MSKDSHKQIKGKFYEVVYTWRSDGRQEVRYRRPIADMGLAKAVQGLHRMARYGGYISPYSLRRTTEPNL